MSDFESSDFQAGDTIKPEREGLPPGYRMRADAHYVELLSASPRLERPRGESTRVREDHMQVRDENTQVRAARDRRVLEHLSADVAAIEAAAAMLSADGHATRTAREPGPDQGTVGARIMAPSRAGACSPATNPTARRARTSSATSSRACAIAWRPSAG